MGSSLIMLMCFSRLPLGVRRLKEVSAVVGEGDASTGAGTAAGDTSFDTTVTTGTHRHGRLPSVKTPRSGSGARREAELEDVIDALKRVVEKQKGELDRSARTIHQLKHQLQQLQEHKAAATARPAESTTGAVSGPPADSNSSSASPSKELEQAHKRLAEMEDLRQKHIDTITALRSEVNKLQRANEVLKKQQQETAGKPPGIADAGEPTSEALARRVKELEELREKLSAEIVSLQQDNADLKRELEAFDLVWLAYTHSLCAYLYALSSFMLSCAD